MKTVLTAGAAFFLGAALGYFSRLRSIRAGNSEGQTETTKKVIWACLIMGFSWVWCSYVLAYLDKAQIAESLSQVAVTEIIGVVLAYCIKSVVENLSKNNHWPDKPEAATQDDAEVWEPEQEEPPDAEQTDTPT